MNGSRFQVKEDSRVYFTFRNNRDVVVEHGYRIYDAQRNRSEMAFYLNDTDANKFAEKLNNTLPQILPPKKKNATNLS